MKRLSLLWLSMAVLLMLSCDSPTDPNGDDGDFWEKTSLSVSNILSLGIGSDDYVFIGTTSEYGSIFRSADNGETWEPANNGMEDRIIKLLAFNPDANYLFAGQGYVSYSTNNGESWICTVGFGPLLFSASTLVSTGYYVFAGGEKGLIRGIIYTDNISSWSWLMHYVPTYSLAICPKENSLLAGTNNGVFRGTSQYDVWTWNRLGLTGESINFLVVDAQGQIFAATENDIFRYSDGEWQSTGFEKEASCLTINKNGDVFAGAFYYGISRFSNANSEWKEVNTGLLNDDGMLVRYVRCLEVDSNGYLYAGTAGDGLWRSSKSTE